MALKLKTGKTISDQFGNEYTTPYGVVDQCNGNKKEKEQLIVFEVYRSKEDRQDKVAPFKQYTHTITGEDFDTFFSAQAITEDSNQYAQSYVYLLQLTKTEKINGEEVTSLVYADWESD